MKFDYCAMHSGAVVGDQDLSCRVIRRDDGTAMKPAAVWAEIEALRETLKRQSKAHHIEVQEQVAAERERCAQIVREAYAVHGLCCADAQALADLVAGFGA